jgi:hypothetical protein
MRANELALGAWLRRCAFASAAIARRLYSSTAMGEH